MSFSKTQLSLIVEQQRKEINELTEMLNGLKSFCGISNSDLFYDVVYGVRLPKKQGLTMAEVRDNFQALLKFLNLQIVKKPSEITFKKGKTK